MRILSISDYRFCAYLIWFVSISDYRFCAYLMRILRISELDAVNQLWILRIWYGIGASEVDFEHISGFCASNMDFEHIWYGFCEYLIWFVSISGMDFAHLIWIVHIRYGLCTSDMDCAHQIWILHIRYGLCTSDIDFAHQIWILHIRYGFCTSDMDCAHQIWIVHISDMDCAHIWYGFCTYLIWILRISDMDFAHRKWILRISDMDFAHIWYGFCAYLIWILRISDIDFAHIWYGFAQQVKKSGTINPNINFSWIFEPMNKRLSRRFNLLFNTNKDPNTLVCLIFLSNYDYLGGLYCYSRKICLKINKSSERAAFQPPLLEAHFYQLEQNPMSAL